MKTLFFTIIYIGSLFFYIKASDNLKNYFDYSPPPITMSQAEIDHIRKQIPYLKQLIQNSIFIIEQHQELKEIYDKNEELNRLKQIKTCIQEVDQENIPQITHTVEGQVKVLYWLVQCSYIHQQLKTYSEKHS